MKKYEDFSENNAFFQENNELARIDNAERALIESEKRDPQRDKESEKGVKFFSLAMLMCVAAAAIMCILIFLVASREPEQEIITETPQESEEWRGAFLGREIYESRAQRSVELCVGKYSTSSWSGFLVSHDGWIATSEQMLEETVRGRIYATLCDGREYPVEQILRRDGIALVKISASGLDFASLDGRALQGGEKIIAVNAYGEVISGEMSSPQSLRVNISCSAEWEGAPLYDENGVLVGMICSQRGGKVYSPVIEDIKSAFLTAKQK